MNRPMRSKCWKNINYENTGLYLTWLCSLTPSNLQLLTMTKKLFHPRPMPTFYRLLWLISLNAVTFNPFFQVQRFSIWFRGKTYKDLNHFKWWAFVSYYIHCTALYCQSNLWLVLIFFRAALSLVPLWLSSLWTWTRLEHHCLNLLSNVVPLGVTPVARFAKCFIIWRDNASLNFNIYFTKYAKQDTPTTFYTGMK